MQQQSGVCLHACHAAGLRLRTSSIEMFCLLYIRDQQLQGMGMTCSCEMHCFNGFGCVSV